MNKEKIIKKIIVHLKKYNPAKIAIFGSFARDEHGPDSDIDILVDFNDRVTFLDFVGIEMELSEILGFKVDLISERAINPKLKSYIEKDMQIIYK